jgi:hypothetical protein
MPPTILKITSIVKPSILNGMSITQAKRNRKKSMMAKGQHITNRIHSNKKAIIVFMCFEFAETKPIVRY